ncbi:tyrosine-type recombinase/integrase, partial [Streptosporangium sp. G11]|uniref:tyrosine-type recombinase/integrase n=1 Tax=Streptosporangium sp. G11 TaxID=3436926 RepID=UPI003EBEC32A
DMPTSPRGRRHVSQPKRLHESRSTSKSPRNSARFISALREHLATYVQEDPGALVFPGAKGGPLRRSGFNTRTRWVDVVREMGLPGLHFHDLRHTGNMLAAESGAGLKDLMARMGHDNVRAAMIYQHAVRGADRTITDAIDRQIIGRYDEEKDGPAGMLIPVR